MSQFGSVSIPGAPTTAQIVPQNLTRTGLMLKSSSANTATIYFAPAFKGTAQTASMMPLSPGESVFFGASPIAKIPFQFYATTDGSFCDLRFIEF